MWSSSSPPGARATSVSRPSRRACERPSMTETSTDVIVEGTEDPAAKDAIRGALTAYFQRVRSGDVGALPALLGIVALSAIFWQLSDRFLTATNLANLP